jgi:hypothetical protein
MLTWFEAARTLKAGDVLTSSDVMESYPDYWIQPNARFRVEDNSLNEMQPLLVLRLLDHDKLTDGNLDDWDGCLMLTPPDHELNSEDGIPADAYEEEGHAWNEYPLPLTRAEGN